MTKEKIQAAIDERLTDRWRERCRQEDACPIAVVAIKQIPGPDFGVTVLCTLEDMSNDKLAAILFGVAKQLLSNT